MAKIVIDPPSLTQPILLYLGLGLATLEQYRQRSTMEVVFLIRQLMKRCME
jgi:hypothetical protein